jgi:hypothetical protein
MPHNTQSGAALVGGELTANGCNHGRLYNIGNKPVEVGVRPHA